MKKLHMHILSCLFFLFYFFCFFSIHLIHVKNILEALELDVVVNISCKRKRVIPYLTLSKIPTLLASLFIMVFHDNALSFDSIFC